MTTVNVGTGRAKSPQHTATSIVAIAILFAMVIILLLNLPPYARLLVTASKIAFGFNLSPWLAYPLATVLLLGIQIAEERVLLLVSPTVEQYERVKWLSLQAYALDLALGLIAWPLVDNVARWWVTKSLAGINYPHLAMLVATVYGFGFLAKQLKNLSKDLR